VVAHWEGLEQTLVHPKGHQQSEVVASTGRRRRWRRPWRRQALPLSEKYEDAKGCARDDLRARRAVSALERQRCVVRTGHAFQALGRWR
jgi:hypothetical protein